jgi:hypothetical protein
MERVHNSSARQLTLVSDSWTNQRSKSVINYVAVTRQHAIFWKTEVTRSERHTKEMIARGLNNTIEGLGSDKAVIAVTTDNASNMKGAWPIVEK